MDWVYLDDCAGLLLRWLHLVAGIAWIGASFYFVWLDNSLKPPVDPELKAKGVAGELWAVHGGGFYNPQKYGVAPSRLPAELHWFKWEAYTTWLSGMALMLALYYFQPGAYMIDPAVAKLTPATAVVSGVATLVIGWLVYDGLCRLLIGRSELLFAGAYFAFVAAVAFVLTQLLSGRAAFLHVGAMLGTTMAANVYFWIIPGQKQVVAAMRRGEDPDPVHGIRGKQRSVHNNYLTLPVLFCMISGHYAFTYRHAHAWLVLALIFLATLPIRHFFNLKHRGIVRWDLPAAGAALLLGTLAWIAPPGPSSAAAVGTAPDIAQVLPIVARRCVGCHAEKPELVPAAPAGVLLDTPERVRAQARRIVEQAVSSKAMPLGNVTGMTDAERAVVAAWAAGGAR